MENSNNDNRIIFSLFNEDGSEMQWLDTMCLDSEEEVAEKVVEMLEIYTGNCSFNGTGFVLKTSKNHYNLTKDNNGVVRNRETGELFAFSK